MRRAWSTLRTHYRDRDQLFTSPLPSSAVFRRNLLSSAGSRISCRPGSGALAAGLRRKEKAGLAVFLFEELGVYFSTLEQANQRSVCCKGVEPTLRGYRYFIVGRGKCRFCPPPPRPPSLFLRSAISSVLPSWRCVVCSQNCVNYRSLVASTSRRILVRIVPYVLRT